MYKFESFDFYLFDGLEACEFCFLLRKEAVCV
jgi:hypothetical protein